MRILTAVLVAAFLAAGLLAQKPPDKLVFEAKNGNVAFSHADHVKRVKNDCKTCHPTLWPQSRTAPLNYKAAMHKTSEAKKTSCAAAACHVEGGQAFVARGNCKKCHGTATAVKSD